MLRFRSLRGLVVWLVLAVLFGDSLAATRPLAHTDFDGWRTIASPILSRDGRWLAYSFMPQDGDGDVILREVATGKEHRVPVGDLPPPPITPADETTNPEAPPAPRAIRIVFTSDSQFAVASTYPTKAEVAAARKAKKKAEEMPKGGLVAVKLATGELTRIADVKSFQIPSKGGPWLAFLKEAKPGEKKPDDTKSEEPKSEDPKPDEKTAKSGASTASSAAPTASAGGTGERTYGTELVLRNLEQSGERMFPSVLDYSVSRDGRTLLYTVSSRTQAENGLYSITPGEAAAAVALLAGRGRYSRLVWDREQTQVAFVSDRDTAGSKDARYKLYHWTRGTTEVKAVVTAETAELPEPFVVSHLASASFSRDGKKLFVPAGMPPKPPRSSATTPPDEDKVTADLWHWRDGYVQPMQKARAAQERNRTYRGVLSLASMKYTQLADTTMQAVTNSDDGLRVLGYDDRAYRHLVDFDGRYSDVYLVDPVTGSRTLALKKVRGEAGSALVWSPDGNWASYYQDKQWRVINTATGTSVSLTAKLLVAFHNEENDLPGPPGAYGSAGWLKDSTGFLVYDRYDVWQLFADGRAPKNVTNGHGRANRIQLRVQRIEAFDEDDDERGIDPVRPLVLRGESEDTRASGYFRTSFAGNTAPLRLLWGDKNYRYAGRAKDADALLITASRFNEYPDVHLTKSDFASLQKLTDGGAQLAPFAWGSAELIKFRNADGVPLKAALFKPADFDPKKKYPVIIYLYERLSQVVNNFYSPGPGTSINFPFYVSNGYIVLMPDIVYKTGEPGKSALRSVLPALDAIVAQGFVDEKAVGIQGHSWGGYQIAYMLTQTNRFRAAEAGAPVGNMTSAYSGIRWGTGLPRQFQYEIGQSRIGQPLNTATQLYIDNSPIFHAHRIQTPLLMISNDNDDAVPWYQGIELFLALRRHGKPAWLFNYNGEFHGLRRRANQKDWSQRMHQFFDHYLKGAPAPKWLEEGIPYVERDEEKERFNAPVAPGREAPPPVAAGGSPQ